MPHDPVIVTAADPTPVYLDLAGWARRDTFDFYRGFDKPYFNLCTRLDVAALRAAARDAGASFSLACHFIAIRLANQIEPFRYRLEGGRVRVHPVVHGSTTVLRDNGSFAFADLPHEPHFADFVARAEPLVEAARQGGFEPGGDSAAVLHFTTLPWVHFSSFSHARNWGREDAVPKFAFGRADADGERLWMPMSVEVHHALVDGLHVGQYVQAFEAALREPRAWLGGAFA
jgi:chloramphenicol O-acetyltransferase type A